MSSPRYPTGGFVFVSENTVILPLYAKATLNLDTIPPLPSLNDVNVYFYGSEA